MARKPRNLLENSFVHITQQCELQDFLLNTPEVRLHYLELLKEVIVKYAFVVLAYCIMDNHIHLLTKTGQDVRKVSCAMQELAGRMAQDYNRKTGRKGHFWRDRFASILIGCARHFRNVISYIDANPLNHKNGCDPIRWQYCSYHELQNGQSEVSIVDRARLVQELKMRDIDEFLAWQKSLMEKQLGKQTSASTQTRRRFAGHYALGTDTEMRLLQKRLKKRGQYGYITYLGLDEEDVPLWALDICKQKYAEQWERRHFPNTEVTVETIPTTTTTD